MYSAGLGQVGWGVLSGSLVAMENEGELPCVASCLTWYWLGPGWESGEDRICNNVQHMHLYTISHTRLLGEW